MGKSKVNMPASLNKKCSTVIHTASAAAVAGGAIPIPVADTIPISAAQLTMIVSLGKVFDITISESVAKSIISIGLAQTVGRAVASGLKTIPGVGSILGGIISAATAGALTETLGWLAADDFYRLSIGEQPQNIADAVSDLNDFRRDKF